MFFPQPSGAQAAATVSLSSLSSFKMSVRTFLSPMPGQTTWLHYQNREETYFQKSGKVHTFFSFPQIGNITKPHLYESSSSPKHSHKMEAVLSSFL